MKEPKTMILITAVLAFATCSAFSAVQLRLSDGTPEGTFVITDQDPSDSDARVGRIAYSGPVGTGWNVGIGGTLKSAGTAPFLDIGTLAQSLWNSQDLSIELSESGFSGPAKAELSIGGITDGTVTYRAWTGQGNLPFVHSTLIGTLGPFSDPSFSEAANGTIPAVTPYSLTMETVIHHSTANFSTSFDAQLEITPACDCALSITCPPTLTVNCGGNTSTNATGVPTVRATGDCQPALTYVDVVTPGNCAGNYSIARTWTATPKCGTPISCTQTIVVQDTNPPVIVCVGNKTADCGQQWSFDPPSATDGCSGAIITIVSTVTNSASCGFTATRTWKATDGCGNSSQCSQTVSFGCGSDTCVPTTFKFAKDSGGVNDGPDGNVRTFTANGLSVKITAFSRVKSSGAWSTGYLGLYSGGLGVTDPSEGDGSNNDTHTVDNIDRDNYVLFEFSQTYPSGQTS